MRLLSSFLLRHCFVIGYLVICHSALGADVSKGRLVDPVKVDPKAEAIIKGALKYLAANQSPNGAFFGIESKEREYPIAMTGYALMAFQAAGHLPGEGEYGREVAAGVKYLLDSVADDGLIGKRDSGQYMYFHGVATIALAELYGQTQIPAIRQKLERLIKVIISSQNDQGGWRYKPYVSDADISVTVLQVVALRAAKNGGIKVPQKTIDEAIKYVHACHHKHTGGFSYQPGQEPGFARTAAAIYSLQVCGRYDDPQVKAGSKYLFKSFKDGQRWFTYGNFYAAPAHYMIGGKTWADWYKKVRDLLVEQAKKGKDGQYYWERGRGGAPGPFYTTAVNAMILAMPYHYVPLYQR